MGFVNGLNTDAIADIKAKMRKDFSLGEAAPVIVQATWKEGVITGVDGKLVCYPPKDIQLDQNNTQGPSMDSYCPLIAGGCFVLIVMIDAAQNGYEFELVESEMKTEAEMIGFYKAGWKGCTNSKGVHVRHAWPNDIHLGIIIRGKQTQEELDALAEYSEDHCPSSEIMKRNFPVDVNPLTQDENALDQVEDWDALPVYYDMARYKKIANQVNHVVHQEALMKWHIHNDNPKLENRLMSFSFPNDSNSKLALGFDPPVGRETPYANPVQACLFGGLSSFMHTIAARLYFKGYKVSKIEGKIETKVNKRKIFGVASLDFVFPEGARISVHVVSNAPPDVLREVQQEAELQSPTMMNWRERLPFYYGVAKEEPKGRSASISSTFSTGSDAGGEERPRRAGRKKEGSGSIASPTPRKQRLLNFFWRLSRPLEAGK